MFGPSDLPLPSSIDTEAEALQLARARDPQTWSSWYDSYYPLLYRYAFFRLGVREEAEDVAAQVFLQAVRQIDGYRYRGRPILAWFYTIARNLVADQFRATARSPESQRTAAVESIPGSNPEDGIDGIQLRAALLLLRPEQREVIIHRFLLSHTTREVSVLLGKSEAAIHSLQVRGIEALRKHFAE